MRLRFLREAAVTAARPQSAARSSRASLSEPTATRSPRRGKRSGDQTATFTVSAAVATVSGSITANPTTTTAPGATTLSWNTADATSVFVSGPGVASTSASETQSVTGLAAGTHTFSLTAQGSGGPIIRTATVTVNAGTGVTAAISVSPATMNMGGTATLSWSTANASSVCVTGFGISGGSYQTNPNLTINISGLPPGQSTWTLVAEGSGGPITRTATITVNSTDGLYGSLTITPTVIYSNQSASSRGPQRSEYQMGPRLLTGTNGGTFIRRRQWLDHGLRPRAGEYSFALSTVPALSQSPASLRLPDRAGRGPDCGDIGFTGGSRCRHRRGTYREGSVVTLTATADATMCSPGGPGFYRRDESAPFTVGAQNYAVVANFALRTHTVSASVTPAGRGGGRNGATPRAPGHSGRHPECNIQFHGLIG